MCMDQFSICLNSNGFVFSHLRLEYLYNMLLMPVLLLKLYRTHTSKVETCKLPVTHTDHFLRF